MARAPRSADRAGRADVLVIGGGPAGCAAAIAAAEAGATVVLVDKGHRGVSGAAAAGVPPDPEPGEPATASREEPGGGLADRRWMARVLDETHRDAGSLRGPGLSLRMRRRAVAAGVRVMDDAPALELLRGPDGAVAGAAGVHRRAAGRWTVHAAGVVLATGGCAFGEGPGGEVLTGDGHLMAAELGAELSGMEFSNAYALSPAFAPVPETPIYDRATFTYADGRPIPGADATRGRPVLARTLLTEPVLCVLDGWSEGARAALRRARPGVFAAFDRAGIDPFRDRFPVVLRLEGTVRGTGGLRLVDDGCATTVPGLFATGDAATRELVCGGDTGGGLGAAWALSSGTWAGRAAAARAAGLRPTGDAEGAGGAGMRPRIGPDPTVDAARVIARVAEEVTPLDRNAFRHGAVLADSLDRLHPLWRSVRDGLAPADRSPAAAIRAREAAAMLAHARWMYTAALARTESRGMHRRSDHPEPDPAQAHRLLVGGLDALWTAPDPLAPVTTGAAAAA